MRCNPTARWGPGTTKERAPDTESANELKARLEQMAKERAKQDSMWQPLSTEAQDQGKVNEPARK
jgi:hypothetical protein